MPRGRLKGNQNSTVFSEFDPGIASSPLNGNGILNSVKLEQHLEEHYTHLQKGTDEYKEKVKNRYEELFKDFDCAIEKLLSKSDLDFPVTVEALEIIREMFKNNGKGEITVQNGTANRNDQTFIVPQKDVNGQDSTTDGNVNRTVVSQSEQGLSVGQISSIEQTESVFKKPAGGTRRMTRQNSRIMQKDFITPKRQKDYNIARVTPGPNINRPIGILRRPIPGEMAVSMNGSPLVTNQDSISLPQMTIPLSNGRMMTFVANEGLDPEESICAEIDPDTQQRLNVFYKLLEKNMKK